MMEGNSESGVVNKVGLQDIHEAVIQLEAEVQGGF